MVLVEAAGELLNGRCPFCSHRAALELGKQALVSLTGISALIISPVVVDGTVYAVGPHGLYAFPRPALAQPSPAGEAERRGAEAERRTSAELTLEVALAPPREAGLQD